MLFVLFCFVLLLKLKKINFMKKVIFSAIVLLCSSTAFGQQGKTRITDAETGLTVLTNEVNFAPGGGIQANFKMNESVPANGLALASLYAGGGNPNGGGPAGINGSLKIVTGPSQKGELVDNAGNNIGYARVCQNSNSVICMIIWVKKEANQ
jgi:hypothetical protein